jgi:signal transduction histidine kinase
MKIKYKIILSFFIIGLFPILIFTFISYKYFHNKHFNYEYEYYIGQLYQINSNINNLFLSVEFDIQNLANNKVVTEKNDSNFTSFLNADEKTFKYNIGPEEKAIVDLFNSYLITHPYINSVYMGRENGTFVRSHPRPRPTKYDPRERPWYKLAKENRNKIVRTKPYMGVTSDDVNIGVAKALIDEQNNFYGVIGADVTLTRLSDFVSKIILLKGGYVTILDGERNVLVHPDKNLLYKKMDDLKINGVDSIFKQRQGYFKFKGEKENNYLFFHTDENLDWKVCAIVSEKVVARELDGILRLIIIGLIFITLVVVFISLFITGGLLSPLDKLYKEMSDLVEKIKNNAPFEKIDLKSNDEVQKLADAFNSMALELKNTYNQLNDNYSRIKELDELKSAFISMVSHELRTPLTLIKGSVSLLKDNKNTAELIEMIESNINRLQTTIEDLLDLSKIETGVFNVVKSKGNVTEVLDRTIEEILPSVVGRNVKILKRYDDKPLEWNFDNSRIIRVFSSILSNAIKFSPDNSEITVDLKVVKGEEIEVPFYIESVIYFKNKYLLFSVTDHGIGIEKQYQKKIFEKLYQVEDPLIRKYHGAGIGLTIAKSIVEAHNGVIWCESAGLNKGATFYVLLPE